MVEAAPPKKKVKHPAEPVPTEAEMEAPPVEAAPEAPPKARKFAFLRLKIPALGMPLKLILIILLAVAVLGGGAFWFLGSSKPDEVAGQYCQALKAGEVEKAQALASKDTKDLTLPSALKLTDYSVSAGPTISGSTAEVPVEATFSLDTAGVPTKYKKEAEALTKVLDKPIIAQIVLVKDGLGWKVDQQQTHANLSRAVFGPKGGGLAEKIFGELTRPKPPGGPEPPPAAPPGGPRPTRPAEPPH